MKNTMKSAAARSSATKSNMREKVMSAADNRKSTMPARADGKLDKNGKKVPYQGSGKSLHEKSASATVKITNGGMKVAADKETKQTRSNDKAVSSLSGAKTPKGRKHMGKMPKPEKD